MLPNGTSTGKTPRCRTLAEVKSGLVNIDMILEWLHICTQHSDCSLSDRRETTTEPPLYLIDVQGRTVVYAPPEPRYVALSYVWGREIRHPAQEAERRASYDEGSVSLAIDFPSNLPTVLPQTVEDALTVVTRLGETYLWVDAYCIDQNNEAEKQAQIKQMDKIYSNAFLTVAAVSNIDADAGLPGVSKPLTQTSQPVRKLSENSTP